MRRTKEDAELTRQALLDAALQVFSQKGYDATRLEDIAEAAKVTRGAIYHHFGGKAELYRALVEEASATSEEAVQKAISEGGTFLMIARRVLVYTLDLLRRNARYRQVSALYLFRTISSPELADFHQQHLNEMQEQVVQVAGFFQMGLAQGELHADLDPVIGAKAFLAYQDGLVLLWLLNPALFSGDTEDDALADVFLYGIAGQPKNLAS